MFLDLHIQTLMAVIMYVKLKMAGIALEETTIKQTFAMKFVGMGSIGDITNAMMGTIHQEMDVQLHVKLKWVTHVQEGHTCQYLMLALKFVEME